MERGSKMEDGQWIDSYSQGQGPVILPVEFLCLNNPNLEVGVDWRTNQDSLHNPRPNHCRLPIGKEASYLVLCSILRWEESEVLGSWAAEQMAVCSSLGIQRCLPSFLATGLPGAQSSLKRRKGSKNKGAVALDEKVRREENETNKG